MVRHALSLFVLACVFAVAGLSGGCKFGPGAEELKHQRTCHENLPQIPSSDQFEAKLSDTHLRNEAKCGQLCHLGVCCCLFSHFSANSRPWPKKWFLIILFAPKEKTMKPNAYYRALRQRQPLPAGVPRIFVKLRDTTFLLPHSAYAKSIQPSDRSLGDVIARLLGFTGAASHAFQRDQMDISARTVEIHLSDAQWRDLKDKDLPGGQTLAQLANAKHTTATDGVCPNTTDPISGETWTQLLSEELEDFVVIERDSGVLCYDRQFLLQKLEKDQQLEQGEHLDGAGLAALQNDEDFVFRLEVSEHKDHTEVTLKAIRRPEDEPHRARRRLQRTTLALLEDVERTCVLTPDKKIWFGSLAEGPRQLEQGSSVCRQFWSWLGRREAYSPLLAKNRVRVFAVFRAQQLIGYLLQYKPVAERHARFKQSLAYLSLLSTIPHKAWQLRYQHQNTFVNLEGTYVREGRSEHQHGGRSNVCEITDASTPKS